MLARFLAACLCLCLPATPAFAAGFDAKLFDVWAKARTGLGSGKPVYWYSIGTVRAYPGGKLLYRMEGFDATTAAKPNPAAPLVQQFNRKIYFFRDPATNSIIEEREGKKVEPIAYPYQFITYRLDGDQVETVVEQGRRPRVQTFGPDRDITARWMGDTAVFTAPVYLDLPIPGTERRVQAFENYDFFIQPEKRGAMKEPHQLSWVRIGAAPAWMGVETVVMHVITWRVERFEDMPGDLTAYVKANYPLWQAPPASLEEIRALQAGPVAP